MNLGFYVDSLTGNGNNLEIFNFLNKAINNSEIDNGSIYYDNIDFNPVSPKFGIFNSTDLWFFTGKLITTSWETYKSASKIVNKFKSKFLYTKSSSVSVFGLTEIAAKEEILVLNEEDQKYLKRVTGKSPLLIELDTNSLQGVL